MEGMKAEPEHGCGAAPRSADTLQHYLPWLPCKLKALLALTTQRLHLIIKTGF